jgi:hypothetical protein
VAKFAQVALCAFVVSCAPARSDGPNFLVVVWDDVGTDKVGAYQEHPNPPATPNLDALAAEGMLFQRASSPPGAAGRFSTTRPSGRTSSPGACPRTPRRPFGNSNARWACWKR